MFKYLATARIYLDIKGMERFCNERYVVQLAKVQMLQNKHSLYWLFIGILLLLECLRFLQCFAIINLNVLQC